MLFELFQHGYDTKDRLLAAMDRADAARQGEQLSATP